MFSSTPFVLTFALFLTVPLLFLIAPQILPPKQVPLSPPINELADLSLFSKATVASTSSQRSVHSRLGTHTNPKPKIAFLFLTNSDLTFSPLWEKFFNQNKNKHLFNIYIHADPSATITPPTGVFENKFKLLCLNLDSCYPEEHYFPTLLSMEDPEGCTHYTLTNVNCTDSVDGHPHLYAPEEVSKELVYKLRESNSSYSYLFARKFAPDCLKPLMEIADDVIFRD